MNHSASPFSAPHLASLRSLFLVALHNGAEIASDQLSAYVLGTDIIDFIFDTMRKADLKGKLLQRRKWHDMTQLGSAYPVLAELDGGTWTVVTGCHVQEDSSLMLAVLDPRAGTNDLIMHTREDFEAKWTGRLILCKRTYRITEEKRPFGFGWFLPEIYKYRSHFRDVAIAAMMSNVLSYMTPLFFNVMIDKVIPHHAYNSLLAICAVYIVCVTCDGFFSFMRQTLMLQAGNKIDARLAERVFQHMMRLPLEFFETTQTGITTRNVQQTEGVRGFMTGALFQTLLDLITMPVLLVGLISFSGTLTAMVLCFAGTIALLIGLMVPIYRKQLEKLYHAESQRQAVLIETVHGIRAVKSLGLEKLRKAAWDSRTAQSLRGRFATGQFGIISTVVVTGVQNLMQLALLAVGALLVFDGKLSLGTLIAFNMLSGRVTGPLVSIVSLLNEYQQIALSVTMLKTVMDHETERPDNQHGIRPAISGHLEMSELSFTYGGALSPALDRVSFSVEPGELIGIVGRSGSGKTTITRLMQGIQTAQHGLLKLDGIDIRNIDLEHLRRSIGVVLQDNILFRGTIRDNIAAARPNAPLEDVVEAARMAGADEFIERLPLSYETPVEESATNFSGGQRQRIAIARALMPRPRLLIFDEATSALDPESEAIVQQNLVNISRNRTTIVVSHRLSSLVDADRILVLERGAMVDYAPHSVLVERCDVYRHLWETQTRYLA